MAEATPSWKIGIQLSETRERLNTFVAKDEALTEEEQSEMRSLTTALPDLEAKWRAAVMLEQAQETRPDGESNELRQLEENVSIARYLGAAIEQRSVSDAELEYNQALNIPGNRFPLALLAPEEHRTTTDAESGVMQQSWLDRLLAGTAAERIGVSMRSVPTGVASYPVTTAGATGAQRAREQDAATAAWSVGTKELKPKRNSVHLEFTIEDAARMPGLEDALRRDLRMGLMEQVDRAIFLGDNGATGNAADIVGLTTQTGMTEKTITQANKVKAKETLVAFAELVDGIHAEGIGDLRTVAAVGANVLWLTTIANATAENQTLAQFLMASGLNWTVRGTIEAATAASDWAAFIGRGRGIDGAAVHAIWDSGELVRDPYTKAKSGEVLLTLNYLHDFDLVRPSNFARVKFVA